jgi:hypothetical protein
MFKISNAVALSYLDLIDCVHIVSFLHKIRYISTRFTKTV